MHKNKIISAAVTASITAFAALNSTLTAFAEEADSANASSASSQAAVAQPSLLMTVVPLVAMFAILYFMAIRPQKKRDQELKDMQASIQVGDEIVTGGGIVGIVVSVGDDTVVIETGGAKHKLRIKNWAITENVSASERMKEAKAAAKKNNVTAASVVEDAAESKNSKKKDK